MNLPRFFTKLIVSSNSHMVKNVIEGGNPYLEENSE